MSAKRAWRVYLALLGLLTGCVAGLQLATLSAQDTPPPAPAAPLLKGDWFVKQALSNIGGLDPELSALQAIAQFSEALPNPAAARRIGVVKESILHESGKRDFRRLTSPEATRNLTSSDMADLRSELDMWLRIYGPDHLSGPEVQSFIDRINGLDIGPVGKAAIADVYRRSGRQASADAELRRVRAAAARSIAAMTVLVAALAAGGAVGLVIILLFLIRSASRLGGPPPRIQPSVLMIGFFTYFGALIAIGILMHAVAALGGLEGDVEFVMLQAVSVTGAFALGWSALRAVTTFTGEKLADMGLRMPPVRHALKWGVGGYLASLPLVGAALLVSQVLSKTVFRNVPTPEQPFGPVVAGGGVPGVLLVFVLAAVLAPVAEETFFRGALYGARSEERRVGKEC